MAEKRTYEPGVDTAHWSLLPNAATHPECQHEPVFSGEHHPTHNPIWFWICAKCGDMGKATFENANIAPRFDLPRFAELAAQHHNEPYWLKLLERRAGRQ
jgi:hypothetical protein